MVLQGVGRGIKWVGVVLQWVSVVQRVEGVVPQCGESGTEGGSGVTLGWCGVRVDVKRVRQISYSSSDWGMWCTSGRGAVQQKSGIGEGLSGSAVVVGGGCVRVVQG